MNHATKILVTTLLGATALLQTACTPAPRLPLFTSSGKPPPLVCPEGTFEYCERMSAFTWGECGCVAVHR